MILPDNCARFLAKFVACSWHGRYRLITLVQVADTATAEASNSTKKGIELSIARKLERLIPFLMFALSLSVASNCDVVKIRESSDYYFSASIRCICRWKTLTLFVTPNGTSINYISTCSKAVNFRSHTDIGIWWYALFKSNAENTLNCARLLTKVVNSRRCICVPLHKHIYSHKTFSSWIIQRLNLRSPVGSCSQPKLPRIFSLTVKNTVK